MKQAENNKHLATVADAAALSCLKWGSKSCFAGSGLLKTFPQIGLLIDEMCLQGVKQYDNSIAVNLHREVKDLEMPVLASRHLIQCWYKE